MTVMGNNAKKSRLPELALFTAALIWGSSFIVVKNSVDAFSPNILLGFRFTIGCVLLSLIFHKKLALLNREYLWKGGLIGFFLFAAYSLQTIGITDTTPGKNAFLTAIYCVLVPFFSWFVTKKRPDGWNISAALLCIVGLGLVCLDSALTVGRGDLFTLAGGVLFACHIVAVSCLGSDKDPVLLTIVQFGFVAMFSWVAGLTFEQLPTGLTAVNVAGMLFLAVFATSLCILLQNVGQKGTDPAAASILLSLESVFGVLFSVLLYHEELTGRLVLGFALIFVSVILSETKLSFLRRKKQPAVQQP